MAHQYWMPPFKSVTTCLNSFFILFRHFPPTFSFPPNLENDSFAVKITSGRENEAIHKFIVPHSSKLVKISSLSRTIFQEKYLQKFSSVPIPCCCLSCSYESILRKSKEGNLLRLNIIPCHHWLYLSILDKLKEEYQHCWELLFTSINAKHNGEKECCVEEKINLCSSC